MVLRTMLRSCMVQRTMSRESIGVTNMTIATDTIYDTIEDAARDLYIKALTDIPQDVRVGLKNSHAAEVAAKQKTAEKVMLTVLENVRVADEKNMMVCQDT